ncbi:hypothetical protein H4S00_001018 [Coemansia sp. D1744]|nr:hypothetical protein H4S00_001018 [Coemansia sp. D1744]
MPDVASNNIYLLRSLDKCEQQLTTEPFNEPLDAQQVRRLVNIEHIANMAQSSLFGQEPGSDIERRATELKQRIAPWVERKNALVLQFTRPVDSNSDFEDALVDEQTKGSRVSTPTARVDKGTTAMDRRNELLGETEGLRRRGVVPDNVAGVERLLKSQQETHDDLTAELSQMAQVLKENSLAFGKLVEDDKGLVEETTELLDRSVTGVSSQGARVTKFRKRSWGTTGMTWLAMLVVVSVFFMLVMFIKVAPKRY